MNQRQPKQQQQPPATNFFDLMNLVMGLVYWFCAMWAVSVEVLLRRSFGLRYFGIHAALLVVWIPTFIAIWGRPDGAPLIWYVPGLAVILTVHRIHAFIRWWRGYIEHSYYSGWPHVMGFCGRLNELQVKTFVEPCIVLAIAGLAYSVAPGVGAFFIGAGVCLAVKGFIDHARDALLVMDTHDAYLTQRWLRERLRQF